MNSDSTVRMMNLPSRTGTYFTSQVTERGGEIEILSGDHHGWTSAHRDYAQKHFGTSKIARIFLDKKATYGKGQIKTVWIRKK